MSKFKYGFCAWYTPFPGPFAVEFAGQAGYDGVQINDLGGDAQAFPLMNPKLQKGFLDAAKKYKMEIQMVNLWAPGLSDMMKCPLDSDRGQLGQENIKKGIEACREMGIKNLFIPSIWGGRIDNDYELTQVAIHLSKGSEYAKSLGITFLYESFMGYDNTMRLYEKSGEAFRLVYDSLNASKYGYGDALKEIKKYGVSMIHTIHIKDALENFKDAELIGFGIGRVKEFAEAVNAIGYQGWIVNENNYFSGNLAKSRDPFEMICKDIETLKILFPNE